MPLSDPAAAHFQFYPISRWNYHYEMWNTNYNYYVFLKGQIAEAPCSCPRKCSCHLPYPSSSGVPHVLPLLVHSSSGRTCPRLPFQELLFMMPIEGLSDQTPHAGRDHVLPNVSTGSYSYWIHLQNLLHLLQREQGCLEHIRKLSLCSHNFISKCESGDGFNPACSVPYLDANPALAWSVSPLYCKREHCCLP